MYLLGKLQKKLDRASRKVLNSKTWRIILIVWLAVLVMAFIPIFINILSLGLKSSVPAVIAIEQASPTSIPSPENSPTSTLFSRTVFGQTPKNSSSSPTAKYSPSVQPSITNQPWQWYNIDLFDIQVEIPSNWSVHEINRRSPGITAFVDHDCADYLLVGPEKGEYILLKFFCEAMGGVPWDCPSGTILFSESTARMPNTENNSYSYTNAIMGYTDNGIPICSSPSVWFVGNNVMLAEYGCENINYRALTNFSIPDRIILSLQEK